ncbi:fimbrial protein [Serratia ficaria]|uniref:fimbrial protein n=1 Tax=Serratia ficaria TaxID=61651 RepID=UPI002182B7E5|nr:fimbrial protein [Serratia ficaria]CAI2526430.1 Minor fimbrial protein prsF precursor [Serratia ficaria]
MTHAFNPIDYLSSFGRNAAAFLLCVGVPCLTSAETLVNVSVTVLELPSCVINGNRTIEVDFGDILTVSVDGSNYMKNVDYTLECSSIKSNAMRMMLRGNSTVFDASALQTNVSDFGVALRADGQPLRVNSWLKFTYPDKPLLQAVPVKRAGKKLPGGAFTAGATLLVAYQ